MKYLKTQKGFIIRKNCDEKTKSWMLPILIEKKKKVKSLQNIWTRFVSSEKKKIFQD